MERTRSKRSYYYSDHENEGTGGRTRQRYGSYNNSSNSSYGRYAWNPNSSSNSYSGNGYRGSKHTNTNQDPAANVPTIYRILCHDAKVGGVIGKSGSIVKQIRQQTGAWVNVHELVPGDDERIIEVSDMRRRDSEGRLPSYCPAEAALRLVHDRILSSEPLGVDDPEEGEYSRGYNGSYNSGIGSGGVSNRVATRIVVSRMHVGCLLGKGGKIIEQMRVETKTQIRVLPRDNNMPRCISISEEVVQIVGDANNVKSAVEIIAARLKESQHRDRSHYQNRTDSSFQEDDYDHHASNTMRRGSNDEPHFDSRSFRSSYRSDNNRSRHSGHSGDGASLVPEVFEELSGDDLVFRILCPVERFHRVVGESEGIVEFLQNEIGVDVKLAEQVNGSDERVITIISEEGPDDELFPAQEALLHIQTRIADLASDQDNVIKTRLLMTLGETRCLDGIDGLLRDMEKTTGAKLHIVAKDKHPPCVSATDELLQIEGEIESARDALVEVTSRLRSFVFTDFYHRDEHLPAKEAVIVESPKQTLVESTMKSDDMAVAVPKTVVPLVTRSTLEVVIPEQAVPKLITKSKNKLAQISELSGASVTLVEDRPNVAEKIIKLSGTPEQAERAQSLLQGFILSTLEDGS